MKPRLLSTGPLAHLRTTLTALLAADFAGLVCSLALACFLRAATGGVLPLDDYLGLVPIFGLFLLLYAAFGLYPGILRPASDELKRLSLATSLGFLFIAFLLFLGQQGVVYSRAVLSLAWLWALFLVPLARWLTRLFFAEKAWWGYPVILFSPGSEILPENERLQYRRCGLNICGTVRVGSRGAGSGRDAGPEADGGSIRLSLERPEEADEALEALRGDTPEALAFILAQGLADEDMEDIMRHVSRHFKQVIVQVNRPWLVQFSLRVVDMPVGPALRLRQNLLDPRRMRMKRLLDIVLCALGAVALAPLIPFIGLCIKLDSPGPIFFRHRRIGQHGESLEVFKFRTMVINAQAVLDKVLAENPALRAEWEKDQKLTQDPRLTRVGRFLRRTSLDELPQVINVIKGEMSLVGPRPIVASEVERYGEDYAMYTSVKPGITGLWQVSGRNDVDYGQRVALDRLYVYNWSVWLDIYIIVRTIPALLSARGAY